MKVMPRSLLSFLFGFLLMIGGCAGEVSWYLTINTYATEDSVPVGDGTGLYVAVSTSDGGAYLESARWTVVAAPGPYTLVDRGDQAQFYPYTPGLYVVRFDGWFRASDGSVAARSEQVEVWAWAYVVE